MPCRLNPARSANASWERPAAVRSRRTQDLNADILEGHYSSALGHLANISYRLGQETDFNPRTRAVEGNADATETLGRMEEHLPDLMRGRGLRRQLAEALDRA